jgi:uncharacterized glyoxalase superfamily protein PhnB
LGFTKAFSWKDGAGFCDWGKITFAEVRRDRANIMLSFENIVKPTWIYLDLNDAANLESLYQEFMERDALIVEPPTNQPWNMREMLVKDLDDNCLRIGAPINH